MHLTLTFGPMLHWIWIKFCHHASIRLFLARVSLAADLRGTSLQDLNQPCKTGQAIFFQNRPSQSKLELQMVENILIVQSNRLGIQFYKSM